MPRPDKHQPPWMWFIYNVTFRAYIMQGWATEMHARQECAGHNRCKHGVHEVHTREQLVEGGYECSDWSRCWLMYEIGASDIQPIMPTPKVPDWMLDHYFPLRRATYPPFMDPSRVETPADPVAKLMQGDRESPDYDRQHEIIKKVAEERSKGDGTKED